MAGVLCEIARAWVPEVDDVDCETARNRQFE